MPLHATLTIDFYANRAHCLDAAGIKESFWSRRQIDREMDDRTKSFLTEPMAKRFARKFVAGGLFHNGAK